MEPAPPTVNVPDEMVVVPVNEFTAVKESAPEPDFVNPLVPEITEAIAVVPVV